MHVLVSFFRSLSDLEQCFFAIAALFFSAIAWRLGRTVGRVLMGLAGSLTLGGLLSAGFRANGAERRREE